MSVFQRKGLRSCSVHERYRFGPLPNPFEEGSPPLPVRLWPGKIRGAGRLSHRERSCRPDREVGQRSGVAWFMLPFPLPFWERVQGEGEAWEGEAPAEPPISLVVSHGAQRSGVRSRL